MITVDAAPCNPSPCTGTRPTPSRVPGTCRYHNDDPDDLDAPPPTQHVVKPPRAARARPLLIPRAPVEQDASPKRAMSGWVFAAVSFALGTRVGRRQQRASDIEDLVDGAKTTTVVRDRRKRRSHYDHLIPGNGWECDPANLSPSSSTVSSLMLAREPSFYSSFRPATTDRPLRHSTPGAPGDSEAQRRSLSHQKSLIHIEAAINFLADDEVRTAPHRLVEQEPLCVKVDAAHTFSLANGMLTPLSLWST